MKTKNEKIEKYLNRVPESQKGIFQKAFLGKSKATALKAKCLDCTNFQRAEIENCEIITCPIHPYKPYGSNRTQKQARMEKKTS